MNTSQAGQKAFAAGASIRIMGSAIDMDIVTREFGHSPTHSHRQGDLNQLKEAYTRDIWSLGSPIGADRPLEDHLLWLASVLLPHKEYIFRLRKKYDVDIYCYKTCYTEQASLNLSPQVLRLFIELDMKLGISLIFLPDEEITART